MKRDDGKPGQTFFRAHAALVEKSEDGDVDRQQNGQGGIDDLTVDALSWPVGRQLRGNPLTDQQDDHEKHGSAAIEPNRQADSGGENQIGNVVEQNLRRGGQKIEIGPNQPRRRDQGERG